MKHGESRERVLAAWRNDPLASLKELSKATGLSRTTVNHHLNRLEEMGLVDKVKERGHRGRWKSHMSSEELSRIRREAAIKAKRTKRTSLQERINAVVRNALVAEADGCFFIERSVLSGSVHAVKVG